MSTDLGGSLRCGALLILSVAGCGAPTPSGPSRPAVPFQLIQYEPTAGKVGHHMVSDMVVYENDTPAGQPCSMRPDAISYTGEPPPGLAIPPGKASFEGTPQQPGTWQVTVTVTGVRCTQGTDLNDYGERTINVRFNIEESYDDDDW